VDPWTVSTTEKVDVTLAADSPFGNGAVLSAIEQSVLDVLLSAGGRVVSRESLAERAGLANLSERRVDSVLVALRRALGADSIITVRGRGWRVVPPESGTR
jgi:DNA-binding response OmpR family regulator